MTNGDRIRAMTDEELAEWILTHVDCAPLCPRFDACYKEFKEAENDYEDTPCEQKLLQWLKMEGEE